MENVRDAATQFLSNKRIAVTGSFDERCHHILACEQDGEPAGSARLIVRDGDAAPLHLEGHFAMDIELNSAEISGFTVVSAHRQTKVLAGLARRAI
jgi:hypothetical protein